MAKCKARAEHGRIELIVRKNEPGYDEFRNVLNDIKKRGCTSWYGDIEDWNGKEQNGLVVTANLKG